MDAIGTLSTLSVRSPWAGCTQALAAEVQLDQYTPSTVTHTEAPQEGFTVKQAAVCALSVAALAAPALSHAQTVALAAGPPSSISRVLRPTDGHQSNQAEDDTETQGDSRAKPAVETKPEAALERTSQEDRPTVEDTTTTGAEDVPWYDPVERRAKDMNDGLKGLRKGVDDYAVRLNKKLNANDLAQYEANGQLGDYRWNFDPLTFRVEPYTTLRLNKWGAGIRTEVTMLRGVLAKEDVLGDWTRTQGLRGEVSARKELGRGARLKINGISVDELDNQFVGPRMEAFQQWRRNDVGDWKMVMDFNVGVQHDFTTWGADQDVPYGQTLTYARALQRFENEEITKRWLGNGSRFRAELEEGVQHDISRGDTRPYYRALTSVGKPYSFKLFGGERKVDVEAGVQVQGTKDEPFEVKPLVRARVRW